MATKFKTLIGFTRMKDDELVVTAKTVIGAMTDNTNFASPIPTITDVQGLLDEFLAKLATSRKPGSPEETALKNDSREPLESALQQLSVYVNSVGAGKLSVLLGSGFPIKSPGSITLAPLMVEGARLKDGRQSGQVQLDFSKQSKALFYEYCYRNITEPDTEWSERYITTSSRGNIIAPLEVGQWYEARVRAINNKGVGEWSNAAKILMR